MRRPSRDGESPKSEPVKLRHVSLDKDGTLIDVHGYWAHTCLRRAEEIQRRLELSHEMLEPLLETMGIGPAGRILPGGPVGYRPRRDVVECVTRFLASAGLQVPNDDIRIVFEAVDASQQASNDYNIKLLPWVREGLAAMRAKMIRLSLYSSDRRGHCERILHHLGILDDFQAIIGGDSISRPKPDPQGFLLACEATGTPPGESAYLGDTVDDILMADSGKAALSVAVTTGLEAREELSRHTPCVMDSLYDFASRYC